MINLEKELNKIDKIKYEYFTIPKNTILYTGSMYKNKLNQIMLEIGHKKFITYFSSDKNIIEKSTCNECLFPINNVYIHKFIVTENINNILLLSNSERNNENIDLYFEYLFSKKKYNDVDGIGFYFPNKFKEKNTNVNNNMIIDAEFALNDTIINNLLYIDTSHCGLENQICIKDNLN